MWKTPLPGTGWAETYFWGWFHKSNFSARIIFVLRIVLVFDPFPLWERIRVLGYPCQPFIHSNVPTQMGHFDGSILPQKLVGTYNMWNWTSLGSFNWAKIAKISWKYWKNASAGDWVGRNLFLRVVSQNQLFGAHHFRLEPTCGFWAVSPVGED